MEAARVAKNWIFAPAWENRKRKESEKNKERSDVKVLNVRKAR